MKKLPLHDWHEAHGAKLGEFAGFTMPLYYAKPIDEHHLVRREAGVFDISHMGQFNARGAGTEAFLQAALTNDVSTMEDGKALYSPICREDGGVLDDLIVYRYEPAHFKIIVNAGTREKDYQWLAGIAAQHDVVLEDCSADWCLFAVQGTQAFERLQGRVAPAPESLEYYAFAEGEAFGSPVFIARTGYTGEPGCELAVPREGAEAVWRGLTEELGLPPIGLAARDTLRLEAGMALYEHELREEWNPLESGLGWAVKLDGTRDFVGKAALEAIKMRGLQWRSVGVEVTGRGIPRAGYPLFHDGQAAGEVTSGALSPTTGRSIALARIRTEAAKTGTELEVEIRGKRIPAVVVKKPFYQNPAVRG